MKGILRKMLVELYEEERGLLRDCAEGLRKVIRGAEEEMEADEELGRAEKEGV